MFEVMTSWWGRVFHRSRGLTQHECAPSIREIHAERAHAEQRRTLSISIQQRRANPRGPLPTLSGAE